MRDAVAKPSRWERQDATPQAAYSGELSGSERVQPSTTCPQRHMPLAIWQDGKVVRIQPDQADSENLRRRRGHVVSETATLLVPPGHPSLVREPRAKYGRK